MIGDVLVDKAFMATIPRRIAARMNAIREMSNLGPHGEKVDTTDAIRVMRDLIDVLEWYVVHHDPTCRVPASHEASPSLEILPQLREKYSPWLRPEIKSVKFIQSTDRCHLEITTREGERDDLMDENNKRTDLTFISGSEGSERYFSTSRSLTENAHRFVSDFDAVSIINCTDLFTDEAATRIDVHWREHGGIPVCE